MGYRGSVLGGATISDGTLAAAEPDVLWGKLPHNIDGNGYYWSIERAIQLREVLGAGLHYSVGQGVLTEGTLEQGGVLSVTIPAGEVFYSGGVIFRLLEDAVFNDVEDDADTILWVSVVRTPASLSFFPPTGTADPDTYELEVEAAATAPSLTHIPYAVITAASGAITEWELKVGRKYIGKRYVEVYTELALSASAELEVDHSAAFRRFEVGHTRVYSLDQDGVTATIMPNSISETGFTIALESSGDSPSTDLYGTETELRILVECWGRFYDAN